MPESAAQSHNDSFLKRPISTWLRLDGWTLVALVILTAAVVTRLWDLGARSYNHDEAIHAWESWKLYTGQGYVHSPVYHGPFLYHATALMYFLFGHNDYTGRLAAALFGIGTVALVFFLRRWLGSRGTLVAAALAVISPALLYYGRFVRHDAFSVVFTLLMLLGILNYLEKREDRYLYLVVLGQVLYFSNMETAFIQTFVFWTFLAAVLLLQWLPDRSRSWREFPAFDLLMVMGTLLLPLVSPLGAKIVGGLLKDPLFNLDYSNPAALAWPSILRAAIIWGIFFVPSVLIGLWWDAKRWLTSAGIFYAIYIVLFTTFFTNGQGLATGQVGSLGYWLSQQGVKRGSQPWHYYVIVLPLYEYLPLLFGIIGGAFYLFRGEGAHAGVRKGLAYLAGAEEEGDGERPAVAVADGAQQQLSYAERRAGTGDGRGRPGARRGAAGEAAGVVTLLPPLLIYWAVANFLIFSWSGEKMPWLLVHLTLPLVLLTGWFAHHLLDADWRALARRGAGQVALLLPLTVVAMVGTISARPFTGTSLASLNATMTWLAGFALLLITGLPLAHYAGELGWRATGRVSVVVLFVFLALFTVHNSWMAVYKNGDVAVETLTYAQASPDEPIVMRELERMSRRLTGGEKDLKIEYDDDSSWPFVWYFRDWPNAHFFGQSLSGPTDAAVVIVGPSNEAAVKPFLGSNYYRRQYRLIWWPIEDYKTLTPAKAWQNLLNPATRQSLWNIIMYRKYEAPLAGWPLVNTFAMYVRKDIASQLWDYGPEVAGPGASPAEDLYTTRYQPLAARRTLGEVGSGQGQGQLQEPRGVAVDQDGRLYVADGRLHRIQVYDAGGEPLMQWGSQGAGPGQFQEPLGVAVAPGGVVYVADTWNHRIQKFDRNGKFLAQWGTFGDTQGRASEPGNVLYGPRGVAVDAQGNVWVTDTGNKRVCKFAPDGTILGQYGGTGAGDGQFQEPVGIAIDSRGQIYVADTWNRRVQVFDGDFRYLRQWPVQGWEGQSVANKPYLAVDEAGNVYVTDPEAFRVIEFSAEGQVLAVWGRRGADLSAFEMPSGIAVDAQGRVLVSDPGNHRVLEFDLSP